MNLGILAKRAAKLVADNSPAMLTALGVTGTLTSIYLTAKASFKASDVLRDAEKNLSSAEEVETFNSFPGKAKLTWKLYVPAAGIAALTVAAIVGSNHINTRRAAALASAYSIAEKGFAEYKAKVIDKVGEKKEQAIRDEVAQDKVTAAGNSPIFLVGNGDVICFDGHSGRRFMSSVEKIKKAQNDTNYQINNQLYASLTDFYDRLGLPGTTESDNVGWSSDKLLELEISGTVAEDGQPCVAIDFRTSPIRGYSSSY